MNNLLDHRRMDTIAPKLRSLLLREGEISDYGSSYSLNLENGITLHGDSRGIIIKHESLSWNIHFDLVGGETITHNLSVHLPNHTDVDVTNDDGPWIAHLEQVVLTKIEEFIASRPDDRTYFKNEHQAQLHAARELYAS